MSYSIKYIILILVICQEFAYCQKFNQSRKAKKNVEKFVLASFADAKSEDSVRVVTYLEIPYWSLQFVKKDQYYIASYQASIDIRDKKRKDAIGYITWVDSIIVDNYLDSRSKIKNKKHFYECTVVIDKEYVALGELQDLDTRNKGVIKKVINFSKLGTKPSLLEPQFMLELPGYWGFEEDKIPTNGYRVREIGLGVDLNINGFILKEPYEVSLFMTNGDVIDSLIQKVSGDGNKGYFNETIFIPSTKFTSIKNDFRVELRQENKTAEKIVSLSKFNAGLSSYVYDVELAFKQMRYILNREERKKLKEVSKKKDKEELFYSFWNERDPSPETNKNELMEEYFQRVVYANENFGRGSSDYGWETDRGMIYILFGPPDEIQRTNPSSTSNMLYQVWSYYKINKQFVFRDLSGFGDFNLETPFFSAGF